MLRRCGYPHGSTGGGSTTFLSSALRNGKTGDDPPLHGTAEPSQLARRDFEKRLASHDIFHHKCPLHPSATNVAHLSFCFDQFVELPPLQLFGCPHLMLTALPII